MNRIFILMLILVLVACGGTSMAQSAQSNAFTKPEQDLSKANLTKRDLAAYQKRANQKVEEFFQYLDIIADVEHSDAVRDKALQMAERQFEPSAEIHFPDKQETVVAYLGQCRQGTQYKSVDSMYVSQPFMSQAAGQFQGKIWVRFRLLDSKKNLPDPKMGAEEFVVILVQKEKAFGTTNRVVWELFLRGIEVLR